MFTATHHHLLLLFLLAMTISCAYASESPIKRGVCDIEPLSLPSGIVGVGYSQLLTASGSAGPFNFNVTSGSLPPGLTLATGGLISGTPTSTGSYAFSVSATSASGCPGTHSYTISVVCADFVTSEWLPSALTGTPYSTTLNAIGSSGVFTFAASGLAPGLSISASGVISGAPTRIGFNQFIATATSGNCTVSKSFVITITCGQFTFVPDTLPPMSLGVPFTAVISAIGGVNASIYLGNGSLPTGLTLNSFNGLISGTPTTVGPFEFQIISFDVAGCGGVHYYLGAVQFVNVSPTSLAGATLDTPYTQTFVVNSSALAPFTFTTSGLPSGLGLTSDGVLSGSPTTFGTTNNFIITATSSDGYTGSRTYSLEVVCATDVSITPNQLDKAVAEQAYWNLVSTSRGQGFYDFTLAPGSQLPSGLSLSTSGWINGTTSETGDFTFNVTAQRQSAACGPISGQVSLHVCQSWDVLLSNLTNAVQDEEFEATISLVSSSGAAGPTNWTAELSGGELPGGVALLEDGTVSGVASDEGTFSFTVSITLGSGAGEDQGCVYTATFTITIAASSSAPRLRHWLL